MNVEDDRIITPQEQLDKRLPSSPTVHRQRGVIKSKGGSATGGAIQTSSSKGQSRTTVENAIEEILRPEIDYSNGSDGMIDQLGLTDVLRISTRLMHIILHNRIIVIEGENLSRDLKRSIMNKTIQYLRPHTAEEIKNLAPDDQKITKIYLTSLEGFEKEAN